MALKKYGFIYERQKNKSSTIEYLAGRKSKKIKKHHEVTSSMLFLAYHIKENNLTKSNK